MVDSFQNWRTRLVFDAYGDKKTLFYPAFVFKKGIFVYGLLSFLPHQGKKRSFFAVSVEMTKNHGNFPYAVQRISLICQLDRSNVLQRHQNNVSVTFRTNSSIYVITQVHGVTRYMADSFVNERIRSKMDDLG